MGEPQETPLEQLRLVSLGARVLADGRERTAHVFLADPDSGSVFVLSKPWSFEPAEAPLDGPALAQRNIAAGIPLGLLARGQVVTRSAKRRANLSLELGTRKGSTAMLPGAVDLSSLPGSLYVRRYADLVARLQRRPPRILRPRVLADGAVALAIAENSQVTYATATQTLHAQVYDGHGSIAQVELTHRSVAPHALDALAAGLGASPRAIVGRAWLGPGGLCLEPIAIASANGFVALDVSEAVAAPNLGRASGGLASDPVENCLRGVMGELGWLAHHGLHRSGRDAGPRLHQQVARCERAGLMHLADRLRTLAATPTARCWADAAIWHALV